MTVLDKIAGTLPVGVAFAGKLHQAFELRRSKVADTLAAFDEVGSDSDLKIECAQIARQLVAVGDIPTKDINTALVFEMDELDFETLAAARGLLAKKPLNWPASSIPTWPALHPNASPAPATSAGPSSA